MGSHKRFTNVCRSAKSITSSLSYRISCSQEVQLCSLVSRPACNLNLKKSSLGLSTMELKLRSERPACSSMTHREGSTQFSLELAFWRKTRLRNNGSANQPGKRMVLIYLETEEINSNKDLKAFVLQLKLHGCPLSILLPRLHFIQVGHSNP